MYVSSAAHACFKGSTRMCNDVAIFAQMKQPQVLMQRCAEEATTIVGSDSPASGRTDRPPSRKC
jgi:hypothetical protein